MNVSWKLGIRVERRKKEKKNVNVSGRGMICVWHTLGRRLMTTFGSMGGLAEAKRNCNFNYDIPHLQSIHIIIKIHSLTEHAGIRHTQHRPNEPTIRRKLK